MLFEVTCWIKCREEFVTMKCKTCVICWVDERIVGNSMHQESEVSLVHNCHLPSVFPTTIYFMASCLWPQYYLYTIFYHIWIFLRKLRVSGILNSILLTFGDVPYKGGAFSKNLVKLISVEVHRKLRFFFLYRLFCLFIVLTNSSKSHVLMSKLLMKLESALNEWKPDTTVKIRCLEQPTNLILPILSVSRVQSLVLQEEYAHSS